MVEIRGKPSLGKLSSYTLYYYAMIKVRRFLMKIWGNSSGIKGGKYTWFHITVEAQHTVAEVQDF